MDQPQRSSPVDIHAVGLPVGAVGATNVRAFIPIQAKPLQIVQKLGFVAGFAALQISIFYPQNKDPSLAPYKKPVEQRSTSIAYMDLSGRRGSEAGANFSCHLFDSSILLLAASS